MLKLLNVDPDDQTLFLHKGGFATVRAYPIHPEGILYNLDDALAKYEDQLDEHIGLNITDIYNEVIEEFPDKIVTLCSEEVLDVIFERYIRPLKQANKTNNNDNKKGDF